MKTTVLKPEKYSLIEAVFACHEASTMMCHGDQWLQQLPICLSILEQNRFGVQIIKLVFTS